MEFLEWVEYLDQEKPQVKQEFYLAQIAAECRKCWVKNPNSIKVTDMLITTEKEKKQVSPEVRMANSKAAWTALLGKPTPPKKR